MEWGHKVTDRCEIVRVKRARAGSFRLKPLMPPMCIDMAKTDQRVLSFRPLNTLLKLPGKSEEMAQ